jgi:subtilase family serine protease
LHDFHLKPDVHLQPQLNLASSQDALTPEDVATIYDLKPLYNEGIDGTGVKIAVIAQSNVDLTDIASFRAAAGLPVNVPHVVLATTDPGIQADESEADLDLEWVGGVAKNATILLVVGNPTTGNGVGDALGYAVDNNIA